MSVDALRLETDRLVLRPTQLADLAGWTALFQDVEIWGQSADHWRSPRRQRSA